MFKLYAHYNPKYDYLSVAQIDKSGHIHNAARKVENVLAYGYGRKDAFQCLNPIKPKTDKNGQSYFHRCQGNIQSLKYCYMDIDIPKEGELSGLTARQLHGLMVEEGVFDRLPRVSFTIWSGTGFWLLWQINEHINSVPRWKQVQSRIYEVLKEYGADPTCKTDYARLCRIPGSINSKNGMIVELDTDVDYDISYTLYEMLEMLPEVEKTKTVSSERHKKSVRKTFRINFNNPVYLLRARDIAYLLMKTYRGQRAGMREMMLFLYRYNIRLTGASSEQALIMTRDLNERIAYPLNDKELVQVTASADRAIKGHEGLYRYTNKRLIDLLKITEHEQQSLKTIKIIQESKEDRKKRKSNEYIARVHKKGNKTKSEHKADQILKIKELLENGKSVQEIMADLSISKSTFYRYKRELSGTVRVCEKPRNTTCHASLKNSPAILKKELRSSSVIREVAQGRMSVRKILLPTCSGGSVRLPRFLSCRGGPIHRVAIRGSG